MRFRINILNEPKTKSAAMAIAVSIYSAMERNNTRKENLMKSKNSAQEKISRLTKTLEDLEKQIAEAEASDSQNLENLERLKKQWEFTEAEILELRSKTLREQLQSLEEKKILKETQTQYL